jgi:hypothetical protein
VSVKTKIIGVRVDENTERRLAKFEEKTLIESVALARAAIDASLNFFEEHGYIHFPLEMQPKGAVKQNPKPKRGAKES